MHELFSLRKTNAESLIKYIRDINSVSINSRNYFGKRFHTLGSEPYRHDMAYNHLVTFESPIVMEELIYRRFLLLLIKIRLSDGHVLSVVTLVMRM